MKKTHGMSKTPLYRVWCRMKGCTSSPSHQDFKYYGERGIVVCEEWQRFETFYAWAVSNGYQRGLTIDRIDSTRGYCPSNCQWITLSEQQGKRRDSIMVEINGKTQCLSYWCKELGMNWHTVHSRIKKGWTPEKALLTPLERQVTRR
jgi:hypothetical protein